MNESSRVEWSWVQLCQYNLVPLSKRRSNTVQLYVLFGARYSLASRGMTTNDSIHGMTNNLDFNLAGLAAPLKDPHSLDVSLRSRHDIIDGPFKRNNP